MDTLYNKNIMWTRMTAMKKYIPIVATLFLGIVVLGSQVFFKSRDIKASPSKDTNKINLHYENNLKEVVYKDKGKAFKLKESKAPVVILNFWASWCVPCLEEFPSLVKLRNRFKDQEVVIVGINTDDVESYPDAKKVMKKYKINFPVIFDKKSDLINKFKVSAIPVSIIYNKGKVIEVSNGAKDFFSGEFLEQVQSIVK